VQHALEEWVPLWFDVGKAFTRMTWLGKYPGFFEKMQPKWDDDDSSMEDNSDISDDDATPSGRSSPVPKKKAWTASAIGNAVREPGRQGIRIGSVPFSTSSGTGLFQQQSQVVGPSNSCLVHPMWHSVSGHRTCCSQAVRKAPSGASLWMTCCRPKGVAILEDRGFRWQQRHYPK